MNLRPVLLWMRALVAREGVESDLDEELAFHIEREIREHIAAGVSPVDARRLALARFGSVGLASEQCRDVRGTALVDNIVSDVRYAIRTYRGAPLAAVTIVATVALGVGLVAVVFTVFSVLLLRVDGVRRPGELFGVAFSQAAAQQRGGELESAIVVRRPDYEALRRETDVFSATFATSEPGAKRFEGRPSWPVLVTGNFFQVLGTEAALGRTLQPQDDQPGAPSVVVLSQAGWRKLLRSDPDVLGRRVMIQGVSCEVVGVMPEGFRGLSVTPPDYWAPLATDPDRIAIDIVGRLRPGWSPDAAAAAMSAWAAGKPAFMTASGRPARVSLQPRQGTLADTGIAWLFAPLFFAFGSILAIGCANVANLLLARGVSRQRELGVRMALGGSRRRVVQQLLIESFLLALVAAACGLGISQLVLNGALRAAMSTDFAAFISLMNVSIPSLDWRLIVFLIGAAVVSTMMFALAPALQVSRLDLVRTMRGEVIKDARPRRLRNALITVQVGASAFLLIGAVIFLRGAGAAAARDPGIRTRDAVRLTINDESQRAALLPAIAADPSVALVAASSRGLMSAMIERSGAGTAGESVRLAVDRLDVSSEYFDVLGFAVVSGRGFAPVELTSDTGVVMVSESIARRLWPNGNGVGESLQLDAPRRTLTVIGVVRDPGQRSGGSYLSTFKGVYLPSRPETMAQSWLYLRVRGNPEQVRQELFERLMRVDRAGFPNIVTVRSIVAVQAFTLQVAFWTTILLGGLALVLTASGLFSLLSHLVAQQTKEIGVRVALGATTRTVARVVLAQSLRPAVVGLALGAGLAAAVAMVLKAVPAASELHDWIQVFDPVAYATSVMVIATSCVVAVSVPAFRAARLDPIEALRTDT